LDYGTTGKIVRRRRSWYRRRLRVQRSLAALVVGTLIVCAFSQNAARYFALLSGRASWVSPYSSSPRDNVSRGNVSRGNVSKELALMAARSAKLAKSPARTAGIYPYSVIPGGVKDPEDLRYAALRDYVVRQHYAHFDFNRAHLVPVSEAREVYLSYRIRDTVFWTRRRIRLHLGELLLTDGKITARARCGNQISDIAKPEVSSEEPDEDVLDQPVGAFEPGPPFPARPLLNAPDLPIGNPAPPQLFSGVFLFPYAPLGVPIVAKCSADDHFVNGHCIPKRRPPVVPEPPTMVLIASGLSLILWRYRKTVRPVRA
jgi:hypothetical protein